MEKDGVKMRCGICGRPVDGSEPLLPREPPCGGCQNEFSAALLAGKTPEEAWTIARSNHCDREMALLPKPAAKPHPGIALAEALK